MKKTPLGLWVKSLVVGLALSGAVIAQGLQPKVILDNLERPGGLAIHPETAEIYVSESGVGRIIRVVDHDDQSAEKSVVVEGFGQAEVGLGNRRMLGPCGLLFLNKTHLLIAGRGPDANQSGVSIATLPEATDQILEARDLPYLALPEESRGTLYSLASMGSAIFASLAGPNGADQILASALLDRGNLDKSESYAPAQPIVSIVAPPTRPSPTSITVSPRSELVVGISEGSGSKSQLVFIRVSDNVVLARLKVDLKNMVALTYGDSYKGTRIRALYALDWGPNDSGQGGLFRLDAALNGNRPGVNAVKIAALERPTAMVVGKRGMIYVTLLGEDEETGKLVRFDGDL